MKKIKLDINRLEVVSFETECPSDANDAAFISGRACVTRPTVYGTCCTP
jgi:hypothetical protein